MLEELGVEYDAWLINIMKGDQFTSGFVAANPNSKIPAMYDYGVAGDDQPVRVFETGSILMYLSEKHGGKFMPKVSQSHFMLSVESECPVKPKFYEQDLRGRTECVNWLMWQMGSAPYIGGG